MTRTQMVIVVAMIVCLIGVFVFSTMLIDGLEQCNPSIVTHQDGTTTSTSLECAP